MRQDQIMMKEINTIEMRIKTGDIKNIILKLKEKKINATENMNMKKKAQKINILENMTIKEKAKANLIKTSTIKKNTHM